MGEHQPLAVAVGGGLSAALSHALSYPVDVWKVRSQVNRSWLRLHEGFFHGLAANIVGWSLHGVIKFVGYNALKEDLHDSLSHFPVSPYLVSSLVAETAATVALAPFQVCEVKLVADPFFAPSLVSALLKIVRVHGVRGLFTGLPLLLARQLTASIAKFYLFERIARAAFYSLDDKYADSREISKLKKIVGVFVSSVISSAVCAILSSPFDVLFSHTVLSSVTPSYNQVGGVRGLLAGSVERVLSSTINNFFIWLFYDFFKSLM